jgi:hypothetical protein
MPGAPFKRRASQGSSSGSSVGYKKAKKTPQNISMSIRKSNIITNLRENNVIVHAPGDLEYERAVATNNLLYRFTRPTCVIQPEQVNQIQYTVIQVMKYRRSLTIKNGGHSYSSHRPPTRALCWTWPR